MRYTDLSIASQQIVTAIERGFATPTRIADHSRISKNTVQVTVKRLRARGVIHRTARGHYAVSSDLQRG